LGLVPEPRAWGPVVIRAGGVCECSWLDPVCLEDACQVCAGLPAESVCARAAQIARRSDQ
jgi:hypothetical protein